LFSRISSERINRSFIINSFSLSEYDSERNSLYQSTNIFHIVSD